MAARKLFARLSAFGCGAAVALVALVSLQDVDAASSATLYACAAPDGALRVGEPNVPCGPEERRIRLELPGTKDPECKEDDGRVEKLERRLKDLEARNRRGTMRGRRVVAPFEVVTKQGGRLFRIEEQNVTFYNADGKPVVWIVADTSGGLLQAQSVSGDREAAIGAQDKRAHVMIKEKGRDRIDLGRGANGRYGLQVYGAQVSKEIAYLGQSVTGSGFALVADAAGITEATMFVEKGAGHLQVWNGAGKAVGLISATGSHGAGLLQLTDGAGATMVEAGVTDNGAGVVRTGPNMRNSGVGIVGLVPSFILGKP